MADTVSSTSASSGPVNGSPGITFIRTNPEKLAVCAFASGVPMVSWPGTCAGGLHDGNASAGPCVRLALPVGHCAKAGTSGVRNGVAPFERA